MTTTSSRLAYSDAYEVYDRALADPAGIRIAFSDEGRALHFRVRLHKARSIDREDNAKTYSKDHPLWGRSSYDQIIARVREVDDRWYVYLENAHVDNLEVESLATMEEAEPAEAGPNLRRNR